MIKETIRTLSKTMTVKIIYAAVAGNLGMFLASALSGTPIYWYWNALCSL